METPNLDTIVTHLARAPSPLTCASPEYIKTGLAKHLRSGFMSPLRKKYDKDFLQQQVRAVNYVIGNNNENSPPITKCKGAFYTTLEKKQRKLKASNS